MDDAFESALRRCVPAWWTRPGDVIRQRASAPPRARPVPPRPGRSPQTLACSPAGLRSVLTYAIHGRAQIPFRSRTYASAPLPISLSPPPSQSTLLIYVSRVYETPSNRPRNYPTQQQKPKQDKSAHPTPLSLSLNLLYLPTPPRTLHHTIACLVCRPIHRHGRNASAIITASVK